MNKSIIVFMAVIAFLQCNTPSKDKENGIMVLDSIVYADAETDPVISKEGEDAADDPAIWLHPTDPEKSKVIGTNKKAGLCVYNLKGEELQFYPAGNVNNVDVRYQFQFGSDSAIDILATSNRSKNTLLIMGIDGDGYLMENAVWEFPSNVDEVYGCCLYFDKKLNKHYAFINGKDGNIEQWELTGAHENVDAHIVRQLQVGSQPEGMVADDQLGVLYVGEEMRGIWKFKAGADQPDTKTFITNSDTSNSNISYDIEGLTIYYAGEKDGYLIASSQGNYTYAIFERSGSNRYITSFSIKDGTIDGAEETDGLDVTNAPLGDAFPSGMFVVQDGFNYEGDSMVNQNFKYVAWEKVSQLIEPNLLVNTEFDIR